MKLRGKLKDLIFINTAIEQARRYALERETVLTVERIAVCLGVSRKWILEFLQSDPERLTKREGEVFEIISLACEEAAASSIEFGMMKGGSSTLNALILKNNHGYLDSLGMKGKKGKAGTGGGDFDEGDLKGRVVVFEGEDKL